MTPDGPCGVIFDMDGVLVDSYRPHFESWRRLAAEIGHELTEERFAGTFGRTSREIIAELFHVADPAIAARWDDRKEAIYREIIRNNVSIMPGATDLIAALHASGFRLAIGSSGPRENIELVSREMNLDLWMSATVTGADVTRGKPDPEVFLVAADRLRIPARSCLVIEDAPAGLAAARAAGMKCVGLLSPHGARSLEADVTVAKLSEITPPLITSLLTNP